MEKTFKANGTFQAYYDACGWLKENGYSYGSMCGHEPIGIMKGNYCIAKWKNLTKQEQKSLDGTMTGEFREGDVKITIKTTK